MAEPSVNTIIAASINSTRMMGANQYFLRILKKYQNSITTLSLLIFPSHFASSQSTPPDDHHIRSHLQVD